MENCTLGGDMEVMSGLYSDEGADTFLDLLVGNSLLGDMGEEAWDEREKALDLLRHAGLCITVLVL